VRGETRCRAVSILYQYEIQTDGLGVKGTERAGAHRAVRFCAPFPVTKETERALESPRDVVGKNVKSRDRMLNDKEISVLQLLHLIDRDCHVKLLFCVDWLQSVYFHIIFRSIMLYN